MIEAVPNVSEGRDLATVESMAQAIRTTPDVLLLNISSDPDHNRSVLTYASESEKALEEATIRLFEIAVRKIDLRKHEGAHPRVGAVDVVPFVPLGGSEMSECIELARRVGRRVAEQFDLPVYLYEHAAQDENRRELPLIRSGGFERFASKIEDPRWAPDFGPRTVHPSAGVTIVGARVPLIAFNVQLDSDNFEVAEKIARAVRGVSGGLRFVRALPIALKSRGIVQVSMNLLDYRKTPIHRAFSIVRQEAARYGVTIRSSEIIGLVPADALYAFAEWNLQLENFRPDVVLERRIAETIETASPKPPPRK